MGAMVTLHVCGCHGNIARVWVPWLHSMCVGAMVCGDQLKRAIRMRIWFS